MQVEECPQFIWGTPEIFRFAQDDIIMSIKNPGIGPRIFYAHFS